MNAFPPNAKPTMDKHVLFEHEIETTKNNSIMMKNLNVISGFFHVNKLQENERYFFGIEVPYFLAFSKISAITVSTICVLRATSKTN